MNDFKALLGESITDDTANALQAILDEKLKTLAESKDELQEQIQSLSEQVDTLTQEVVEKEEQISTITEKADEFVEQIKSELTESLTERAEAYAEKVRQETIAEMSEKADAYGEFLMAKADAYGDHLQEQAEKYAEQQADAYGDYLQEKAEAYGSHLIAEGEAYGKQVEEKCLKESAEQIEAFKQEHLELFEQVDEYNRMKMVFGNLKSLVEASGFTLEEDSQAEKLAEDLKREKIKARKLQREINENQETIKEYKIKQIIESSEIKLTMIDAERVVNKAMGIVAESDEELNIAVNMLIENVESKNTREQVKVQIEDTKKINETTTSGWGSKII